MLLCTHGVGLRGATPAKLSGGKSSLGMQYLTPKLFERQLSTGGIQGGHGQLMPEFKHHQTSI